MKAIGLTGGVGMGKSTVADRLARRGLVIIDTDLIARELVEPGQSALELIRSAFGGGVIGSDGALRRDQLARLVFEETPARLKLEAILHPRIHEAWKGRLDALSLEGCARAVVVIPLLFETDSQSCFENTVCVGCSRATQALRLRARGWTEDQVRLRNAAQLPIETKLELSDRVLWNEGGLDVLDDQIEILLRSLVD